ncbi:hypothetical protein [Crocosphaera sp.]|nr:hypothetical protein [Crocosphaera sp.]MDJ0582079.1 hypothetical protein [Crocosphaera sp.]
MKFWIDAQLPPQLAQWLMITLALHYQGMIYRNRHKIFPLG